MIDEDVNMIVREWAREAMGHRAVAAVTTWNDFGRMGFLEIAQLLEERPFLNPVLGQLECRPQEE